MRTKTVFENVYDVWAQQERPFGRNARGNQSFRTSIAYSYAEPIARIMPNGVVLYRDCHFSITTTRHQSQVKMATTHYKGITCRDIGQEIVRPDNKANLAYFKDEISKAAKRFYRAREKDWAYRTLQETVENANAYCEYFKLKTRFSIPDEHAIRESIAKDRIARKEELAQLAKQEAEREAQFAENLTKWLAGDPDIYRSDLPYGGLDYLRLKPGNPDIVQTSRGVDVPTPHVKRALRHLAPIMEKEFVGVLDSPIRIGEYKIISLLPGQVPVGCHRFSFEEIKRFSSTLTPSQE